MQVSDFNGERDGARTRDLRRDRPEISQHEQSGFSGLERQKAVSGQCGPIGESEGAALPGDASHLPDESTYIIDDTADADRVDATEWADAVASQSAVDAYATTLQAAKKGAGE